MAVLWTFRCYVSLDGTDQVRKWYDSETKKVQAKFFSRLRMLAQVPLSEWNDNLYKNLHGDGSGLGEIRFKAENVQQRPIVFRSGETEFTILFCATEKSNRFVPRNTCDIAQTRKAEVVEDRGRCYELWLALE